MQGSAIAPFLCNSRRGCEIPVAKPASGEVVPDGKAQPENAAF